MRVPYGTLEGAGVGGGGKSNSKTASATYHTQKYEIIGRYAGTFGGHVAYNIANHYEKTGEIALPNNTSKEAHYNRNNLNREVTYEQVKQEGWIELEKSKSVYHMLLGQYGNVKFVSPNGQFEAVFNSKNELVKSSINMGTYNYCGPTKSCHFGLDVVPYYLWGNTPEYNLFQNRR